MTPTMHNQRRLTTRQRKDADAKHRSERRAALGGIGIVILGASLIVASLAGMWRELRNSREWNR